MEKPGASPQENAGSRNSAEGAKFSDGGETSVGIHTNYLRSSLDRAFQRFLSEATWSWGDAPGFAFRALGA